MPSSLLDSEAQAKTFDEKHPLHHLTGRHKHQVYLGLMHSIFLIEYGSDLEEIPYLQAITESKLDQVP